ncbi:uncharacterized protein C8A04DRAFT_23823 [Dichotomopilus funicola]|uniref:RAD52 homolog n=1 Tax=Dichotomopilus funicola TaxID=1934379 RepID=A0AAN6VB30_9PEZI|nr:hypothetical protein C8A04DRAFT_23823 [Dichotomopilus funicola]
MPAPGDQHTGYPNPFAEPQQPQQRISEFTAQEIATLQCMLEKQLGPEYLSSRAGPSGSRLHYITAEKCISLANEVFGFNGWSSAIKEVQVDFVEEDPRTQRVNLGLSVTVRVTLRDGTYHEDIGYGNIENARNKAAAFEKAKKEGTTDALKRALRHFGNVLGNCIYDKDYLAKVTKLKVQPARFDENGLHRHPDFVVKKEPQENSTGQNTGIPAVPARPPPRLPEPPQQRQQQQQQQQVAPPPPRPQLPNSDSFDDFLGDLDEEDFNIAEEHHFDGVLLPNSADTSLASANTVPNSHNPPRNSVAPAPQPPVRQFSNPNSKTTHNTLQQAPQTPIQQQPARPNANNFPGAGVQNNGSTAARPPQQFSNNQNKPHPQPQPNNANQARMANPQSHMTPLPQPNMTNQPDQPDLPGGDSVGFFSARAVNKLPGNVAPNAGQAFNPRLESPSIRRTPGVDHTVTKPWSRSGKHVPGLKGDGENKGMGDEDLAAAMIGPGQNAAASNQVSAAGGGGSTGAGRGAMSRPGGPIARPNNVVNPQLDHTRRIGAPVSSSPLGNRGQFKPPTVKRPAAADGPAGDTGTGGGRNPSERVPLEDVSSNGMMGGKVPDAKRQRTT